MKRKQKGFIGLEVAAVVAAFLIMQGSVSRDLAKTAQAPGGPVCHNYNNIGCK